MTLPKLEDYMEIVREDEFDNNLIGNPSLEYGNAIFDDFISVDELIANAFGDLDMSNSAVAIDQSLQVGPENSKPSPDRNSLRSGTALRPLIQPRLFDFDEAVALSSATKQHGKGKQRQLTPDEEVGQDPQPHFGLVELDLVRSQAHGELETDDQPSPESVQGASTIRQAMATVGGHLVRPGPKFKFSICHQCHFINNLMLCIRCL